MSINPVAPLPAPDYDLQERRLISSTAELKAVFHPLRGSLLDLLLERAATVAELAEAVGRPASTVAYHVGKLVDADILTVVRTRRVRAIEERWYGRTARTFVVGQITTDQLSLVTNYLAEAATESVPAHAADELRANMRHAHVPESALPEFWSRVLNLFDEFSSMPTTGERSYGFVAGLYPTDAPRLARTD